MSGILRVVFWCMYASVLLACMELRWWYFRSKSDVTWILHSFKRSCKKTTCGREETSTNSAWAQTLICLKGNNCLSKMQVCWEDGLVRFGRLIRQRTRYEYLQYICNLNCAWQIGTGWIYLQWTRYTVYIYIHRFFLYSPSGQASIRLEQPHQGR